MYLYIRYLKAAVENDQKRTCTFRKGPTLLLVRAPKSAYKAQWTCSKGHKLYVHMRPSLTIPVNMALSRTIHWCTGNCLRKCVAEADRWRLQVMKPWSTSCISYLSAWLARTLSTLERLPWAVRPCSQATWVQHWHNNSRSTHPFLLI